MNIPDAQELKRLQTYSTKLKAQIESIEKDISGSRQRLSNLQKKRLSVQEKIRNIESSSKPTLTEHAILRYLERAKGINLEEVHKEIMTDQVVEIIKTIRNGKVPIGHGLRAVVRQFSVVTVEE